jgi:hypothetical protein
MQIFIPIENFKDNHVFSRDAGLVNQPAQSLAKHGDKFALLDNSGSEYLGQWLN